MKLKNITLVAAVAAVGFSGCKTTKTEMPETAPELVRTTLAPSQPVNAIPKAVVYKMEGDAGPENVPVTVNTSTGELISFPGPRDVVDQEPIALGRGWYLDRRGINENSRFTRWTYSEYQNLESVPSTAEIKANIIPGARAVDIRRLQMPAWEAAADTAAVKKILGID